MTYLRAALGLLGLRSKALQFLEGRGQIIPALLVFTTGFLAFGLVRGRVYAGLGESQSTGPLGLVLRFGVLPALLYFNLVLIPVLAVSMKMLSASRDLPLSLDRLRNFGAVMLPLWGMVLLVVAPLQFLFPEFLVAGEIAISVGLLTLFCTMVFYTAWVVATISHIGIPRAAGAVLLGCLTLPVLYILNMSGLAVLAILLLVALLAAGFRR